MQFENIQYKHPENQKLFGTKSFKVWPTLKLPTPLKNIEQ